MKISIKLQSEKIIELFLEPDDTIKMLKTSIRTQEGISILRQCLIYNYQVLRDDHTISNYSISNGSMIYLLIIPVNFFHNPIIEKEITNYPMKIFLRLQSGRVFNLDVERNDTIKQVKEKIYKKIKLEVDRQRLIFAKKQLADEQRLFECKIENGNTVMLIPIIPGC